MDTWRELIGENRIPLRKSIIWAAYVANFQRVIFITPAGSGCASGALPGSWRWRFELCIARVTQIQSELAGLI